MDPQQQQQEMSSNSNTLENMLRRDKKAKAGLEHAVECPRCESTNTKFCYYNNYSLSQPRYFCKSCRRYWTKGGTLRNVPVGGGCRKNKRSSSSKRSHSQDHQPLLITSTQNPLLSYDSNEHHQFSNITAHEPGSSFLDALRCGNPNFQNLYYGYGENIGSSGGEMVLPYDQEATTTAVTVTTMKQEMCNGIGDHSYRDQVADSDQNKMFWGLPWQINGSDHTNNININMGDLDSGRESWTGFAPSWHGLLNSPLM